MRIDYDPAKNARNVKERQLSFERARDFDFDTAEIHQDGREAYPEERYVALGMLDANLHVLCFTPIEGGVRVISLRKANRTERKIYANARPPYR